MQRCFLLGELKLSNEVPDDGGGDGDGPKKFSVGGFVVVGDLFRGDFVVIVFFDAVKAVVVGVVVGRHRGTPLFCDAIIIKGTRYRFRDEKKRQ